MKYQSITKEAALCRKANANTKAGDLVWFFHHQTPIEILPELPETRILFVLSNKSEKERAARLHWFRKCEIVLPPGLEKAHVAWGKACTEWDKACAKWGKARAERDKAYTGKAYAELEKGRAERDKACIEWDKAYYEWCEACAEHADEINSLVALHLPGCPWNGTTLFK